MLTSGPSAIQHRELRSATTLRNFAVNLRYISDRRGSISTICRAIGINRQQFNKYLSGTHLPTPTNIKRIANYFGLPHDLLCGDHDRLLALVEGNYFHIWDTLRGHPQVTRFLETITTAPRADLDDLVGVYDRYQYSSIYEDHVLRSAFCIYKDGDLLHHYYTERFPKYGTKKKAEFVFKYHGFVLPIDGRIFTVDFEGTQRNEMTFGIYSLVKRSAKRFILGISSGIAANMLRQPYSTRVALSYKHAGLITRDDLRMVTVLDRNDSSIPREVVTFLRNGKDMLKPD
jgi:hypothetical protein